MFKEERKREREKQKTYGISSTTDDHNPFSIQIAIKTMRDGARYGGEKKTLFLQTSNSPLNPP